MWYGAYLVIASEVPSSSGTEIIVEEPIYLIEAENLQSAEQKAKVLASNIAETGISFHKDKYSKNVSYGFRRIVEISNPDLESNSPPKDTTEVCYQVMKFRNRQQFEDYRRNIKISAEFYEPSDFES